MRGAIALMLLVAAPVMAAEWCPEVTVDPVENIAYMPRIERQYEGQVLIRMLGFTEGLHAGAGFHYYTWDDEGERVFAAVRDILCPPDTPDEVVVAPRPVAPRPVAPRLLWHGDDSWLSR